MTEPPQTLDETLTARLRAVVTGGAPTEGELRLLAEQGHERARSIAAAIEESEAKLGELVSTPDAPVREMAAELRRVERLREDLHDLRADLAALERRARSLRGAWVRR